MAAGYHDGASHRSQLDDVDEVHDLVATTRPVRFAGVQRYSDVAFTPSRAPGSRRCRQ